MAKNKMTICKHCGAEIAAAAKTCPKCGGKNTKPVYKRAWFWILMAVLVLGIGGMAGGSGGSDSASTSTAGDTQTQKEEAPIEYTAVTVDELTDALDNNPAAASDEYKGNYYELTGRLNVIDSDGNYISLTDINDEWAVLGVQCYIKNDEQLDTVKKMSMGQEVTVKGKITDVGEIMGYSLDIDSIE